MNRLVETMLHLVARAVVQGLQALPLPTVARIGRALGALAYWLDARHRRVATQNLAACLGQDKSPAEIRALAQENFRRIGENFCSSIKTASMTFAELRPHLEFRFTERLAPLRPGEGPQSRLVAIGHFGNFELYARVGGVRPEFRAATTYRALRQASIDRLLRSLRERSGCLVFERCSEAAALKTALREQNLILGLLADQNAGVGGLRLPFVGRDCSTSTAPAAYALRYHCPLYTAICYRVDLAQWRIEVGEEIPTHQGAHPRPIEAITRDVNQAFEVAVRRDPANWFWVHNRWKSVHYHRRQAARPEPPEAASPLETGPAATPVPPAKSNDP
jgi:lauroyl/myristoyl acyltransferase